jgi:3-deoxy-D-manno-octulosonic-acid transferase
MYDNGAGVLVDKEKDIAKAIIELIQDEKVYSNYRNNALKWAKAMDKKKLLDNLYEYLVPRG